MGKITFQNLPNTTTPINATNLNTIQDISTTGSNENGYYVKYDDGTMIQWGKQSKDSYLSESSLYTTVQGTNWYRSNITYTSFPVSFIDTNYSVSTIVNNSSNGARIIIVRLHGKNTNNFGLQLISNEDFISTGTAYTNLNAIEWMAIGRWKS